MISISLFFVSLYGSPSVSVTPFSGSIVLNRTIGSSNSVSGGRSVSFLAYKTIWSRHFTQKYNHTNQGLEMGGYCAVYCPRVLGMFIQRIGNSYFADF